RRHGADGLLDRHVGIDAVEVVEIDVVEAEVLQAAVDRLAQVRRAALAGLGGDDGPVATIADGAPDEPLALAVAVGFRGVDQRDARVERAVDGENASLVVAGVVPASERHGAERDRADAHLTLSQLASLDHRASFVAPSTVHTGRTRGHCFYACL